MMRLQPSSISVNVLLLLLSLPSRVPVLAQSQAAIDHDPVVKKALLESLRKEHKPTKYYIQRLQHDGVNFRVTSDEEKEEIRRAAAYLGKSAVEDLIATINSSQYKVVILITKIDPIKEQAVIVSGQNYGISDAVQAQLKRDLTIYDDILVSPSQKPFMAEGDAKDDGLDHKANFVIWGYFVPTTQSVRLYGYFTFVQGVNELRGIQGAEILSYQPKDLELLKPTDSFSNDMESMVLISSGIIRFEAKDFDGAIKRFNLAVKVGVPDQIVKPEKIKSYQFGAHLGRGISRTVRNTDGALEDLSTAIDLKPDAGEAYFNRGIVYQGNYSYDLAISDYEKAVDLLSGNSPDLITAYINLAGVYLDMSDNDWKQNPTKAQAERDKAKSVLTKSASLTNDPQRRLVIDNYLKRANRVK